MICLVMMRSGVDYDAGTDASSRTVGCTLRTIGCERGPNAVG
jgi:hypothetical protein